MREKIVILMENSLFAEGVVNRLRQDWEWLNFCIVDAQDLDAVNQVVAAQPSTVILAENDPAPDHCSLDRLLAALPSLKVIRLDPQTAQVQVIEWKQYPLAEVRDLIQFFEPSDRMLLNDPTR